MHSKKDYYVQAPSIRVETAKLTPEKKTIRERLQNKNVKKLA